MSPNLPVGPADLRILSYDGPWDLAPFDRDSCGIFRGKKALRNLSLLKTHPDFLEPFLKKSIFDMPAGEMHVHFS